MTHLPAKRKKLLVILRWLASLFQADRLYSEAEVNAVLKAVYEEDYVSLRRELVDYGYLRRERGGGKYWLAPDDLNERGARGDINAALQVLDKASDREPPAEDRI
jgi:hypothetical protein